MLLSKFKYFGVYIIPFLGIFTFNVSGVFAYLGLLFLFVFVPILELMVPVNRTNFDKTEKKQAQKDFFYDGVLYLLVPMHLWVVYSFLVGISNPLLATSDAIAYVFMMGTVLGVVGINLGHELGHKTDKSIKMLFSQIMLTTSIQNHFTTYHNAGHHKDVATPADYTSAEEGANFYLFAIRSQIGGYFKTWRLESKKLRIQSKSKWSNPMFVYTLVQLMFFALIFNFFGLFASLCYFAAGVFGISILEAQNYFAHYGLRRKKDEKGRYEKVQAHHSWNSDHVFGRVLLFELTRHSDHHHLGGKPYQMLNSKPEYPTLPYGYPAMLLLSYVPFLFRPIMKKQLMLLKLSQT